MSTESETKSTGVPAGATHPKLIAREDGVDYFAVANELCDRLFHAVLGMEIVDEVQAILRKHFVPPRPAQTQAPAESWRSPGGLTLTDMLASIATITAGPLHRDVLAAMDHFHDHPPEVAAPLREERDRLARELAEAREDLRAVEAIEEERPRVQADAVQLAMRATRRAEAAEKAVAERDARIATLEKVLHFDKPWPAHEVLTRLANAVEHGLAAHSCDHHGHEGDREAMLAARSIVAALGAPESQPPAVPSEAPLAKVWEAAALICDNRANGHPEGSAAALEARKCANVIRSEYAQHKALSAVAEAPLDALREAAAKMLKFFDGKSVVHVGAAHPHVTALRTALKNLDAAISAPPPPPREQELLGKEGATDETWIEAAADRLLDTEEKLNEWKMWMNSPRTAPIADMRAMAKAMDDLQRECRDLRKAAPPAPPRKAPQEGPDDARAEEFRLGWNAGWLAGREAAAQEAGVRFGTAAEDALFALAAPSSPEEQLSGKELK